MNKTDLEDTISMIVCDVDKNVYKKFAYIAMSWNHAPKDGEY